MIKPMPLIVSAVLPRFIMPRLPAWIPNKVMKNTIRKTKPARLKISAYSSPSPMLNNAVLILITRANPSKILLFFTAMVLLSLPSRLESKNILVPIKNMITVATGTAISCSNPLIPKPILHPTASITV